MSDAQSGPTSIDTNRAKELFDNWKFKPISLICDRVLLGDLKAKFTQVELTENGILFTGLHTKQTKKKSVVNKFKICITPGDILSIKLSRLDDVKHWYLFIQINKSAAEKIVAALDVDEKKFNFLPSSEPWARLYFSTKYALQSIIRLTKFKYDKSRTRPLRLLRMSAEVGSGLLSFIRTVLI